MGIELAQYPLINGVWHSWAEVEIKFAGNTILGITKVDYSDKLSGAPVRGAGPLIIGYTTGNQEVSGSFTLLLESFQQLINLLAEQRPTDSAWKLVPFDISVSYDGSASGLSVVTDTIKACRIEEVKVGTTEAGSTDPMTRECTILHQGVIWGNVSTGNPLQPRA